MERIVQSRSERRDMTALESSKLVLEEFGVFRLDPLARDQHAAEVLAGVAERRASLLDRDPGTLDSIFGGFLLCFPGFPQRKKYTRFMADVRRELCSGVEPSVAKERILSFFTDDALQLELYELVDLVNRRDALDEKLDSGRVIRLFNGKQLEDTKLPKLGGEVSISQDLPPYEIFKTSKKGGEPGASGEQGGVL